MRHALDLSLSSRAWATPRGVRADLAILQSKGQPFFLHDFSRTDLTWQAQSASAPQPPADDPGEPVALALSIDQIGSRTLDQVMAGQPNLVPSQDLTTWTLLNTSGNASRTTNSFHSENSLDGVIKPAIPSGGTSSPGEVNEIIAVLSGSGTVRVVAYNSNGSTAGVLGLITLTSIPTEYKLYAANNGVNIGSGGGIGLLGNGSSPADCTVYSTSYKDVPGNNARQLDSTGARPTRQAGGVLRFDGSDDNLLSALTPGASGTLIVAFKQSSLSAGLLVGARESTSTRVAIGVNGAGQLLGHVGSQTGSTIVGGSDLVGQRAVGALTYDGATVNLYANGVNIYSGAQVGTPTTLRPFRIGSGTLSDGTAESWIAADFYQAAAIQAALTPAEIDSILNFWSTL